MRLSDFGGILILLVFGIALLNMLGEMAAGQAGHLSPPHPIFGNWVIMVGALLVGFFCVVIGKWRRV